MIKVNLLPEEYKRKRRAAIELNIPLPLPAVLAGAGVLALVLLVSVSLFVGSMMVGRHIQATKRDLAGIQSRAAYAEQLVARKAALDKKMSIIESLVAKRTLWWEKLNRLAYLVPDEVWLTRVSTEKRVEQVPAVKPGEKATTIDRYFLVITGLALPPPDRRTGELGVVSKFIRMLKEDPKFMAGFKGVEQDGPIQLLSSHGYEMMEFKLACEFDKES